MKRALSVALLKGLAGGSILTLFIRYLYKMSETRTF